VYPANERAGAQVTFSGLPDRWLGRPGCSSMWPDNASFHDREGSNGF
jgi:hypothetical protein